MAWSFVDRDDFVKCRGNLMTKQSVTTLLILKLPFNSTL